jgi:uncharacterized protein YndB with AHSA1/START domain
MATTEVSETIACPPDRVFALVAYPDRHPTWQHDLDSDGIVSGDGTAGSRGREVRTVMGRSVTSEYEVTEWVANERWGYRSVSGPIQTSGVITCTPVAGGVRVTATLSFAGWSGEAMSRFARCQFGGHLRTLKELLERESAAGSAAGSAVGSAARPAEQGAP